MLEKISCNESLDECVVLLHGYGADMRDLWGLKTLFPGKCIMSLQAPLSLPWGGFSWFDIDFTPSGARYDERGLEKSILILRDFVEKLNLKYKKVWLCGFSQGSIISHALFVRYQPLIAGAACLSGRFVKSIFTDEQKGKIINKPLFISHGTEDQTIPYESALKIENYYKRSAVDAHFRKYRMGHEISLECQRDLKKWFEKRCLSL